MIKTKSFYVATKYFYVAIELAKVKRIYVATEYFCVAIEFGLGRGFYVATESSRTWGFPCRGIVLYVATVGQGTTSQPGCVCVTETLCCDSVALCCVAVEKAMRA